MRKSLAILALLVFVSGFTFAADSNTSEADATGTAVINVNATIGDIRPVFQLKISGTDATTNSRSSDGSGNRYSSSAVYDEYATDENAIDIGFSIREGGRIVFQALLNNSSRTTELYTLTFGGGVFNDVVRRGTGKGTRAPQAITTEAGATISGISSISLGDPAGEGGESNKVVNVRFNGSLSEDVSLPYTLATAEYTYPKDSTIDTGVYYTDVTLTVSSGN